MRRNPNSTPGQEQSLTTASTATDGDGNGAFDHEPRDCIAALRTELSDDGHHGLGEWVSQAAHDRAEDRHAENRRRQCHHNPGRLDARHDWRQHHKTGGMTGVSREEA